LKKYSFSKPRLEAEKLVSYVLNLDRIALYIHHERELTEEEKTSIKQFLKQMVEEKKSFDEIKREKKDYKTENLDIFKVGNQLIASFQDDAYLLPYIGYFMFYLGVSHYYRDGITKKSPCVSLYENFIKESAFIAKQSQEVVRKYRLLRMYFIAPKYFLTITHPVYQFLYKGWSKFRKLTHKRQMKELMNKND